MSSRREVFIRILALLQRKTLNETKNLTLKCLKRHYSTVRSMKNVAVLTEDGAFALFFRPHLGRFDSSRVPIPGNLPSKAKNDNTWGSAQGGGEGAWRSWNWLMHYVGGVTVTFFLVFHLSLWTHYTWSKFYMYLEQKYFRSWSLAFALTLMVFVLLWAFHL